LKPEQIAQAYVDSIELEERLTLESPALAEEAGALRAELHSLLMEAFREAGIPFSDRADAARIAYGLTRRPVSTP
jgi:hypothetical protein